LAKTHLRPPSNGRFLDVQPILLSQHAPLVFLPHFVGDAFADSWTSSANGALGRHERHDSAGMRLVIAASW
jgi:hypothetical protein